MSEGIDFYDDQARTVIAFGIPYPPVNELEIRLKREYNDAHCAGLSETERGMNGKEWYDAQAFRAVFQATGRCIRHSRDYGAVILIDGRFGKHLAKFPRWMQPSFQLDVAVPDVVSRLSGFFADMEVRFPVKEALHLERPLLVGCAACGAALIDLESLKAYPCSALKRAGLLRLLECDRTEGFLGVTKGTSERLHSDVIIGDISFSDPDCSGYSPVQCQCGAIVGAKLIVGGLDDIPNLDGIWFALARVEGIQAAIRTRLDAVLVAKPSVHLGIHGKGQQVLSCLPDQ
jgi:hypothetical protein